MTKIGVLALQGGVAEHLASLRRLDGSDRASGGAGIEARRVLVSADLDGLDGIILPGGESTAVGKLLAEGGLGAELKAAVAGGLAAWGTCMGAILLARAVGGGETHLSLMDIRVERNAYGSQLDSFTGSHPMAGLEGGPFPMVFIRAPVISFAGPGASILARVSGDIVGCRQGRLLATTFHPELTADTRVHAMFVRMARGQE
ncbi:MAG TPA: pyridoxal 5'-phosphate synthase glutaminase subunit PdxT [Treponema sp.]|nr:MAG: glutamine amidotransferase subunit PdxT [Treponema sp. GWC1_61_84]HCM25310.1 pyridoxal 5'-phosphate synthase glutaminase subunit PdxT [Treponema sp.]